MKKYSAMAALAFTASVLVSGAAVAQMPSKGDKTESSAATQAASGMRLKMDRNEFLKSHRWDEARGAWVMQKEFQPPEGVMSRAEVKAARDGFLSKNRWDETAGGWRPVTGEPRNMSALSRAEVRADTARFTKTHRWDESTQTWEMKAMPNTKPKS